MSKNREPNRVSARATHSPAPKETKPVIIPGAAKILCARQVRELLGGKSEMFLYRLLTERAELKFPRPFKINRRNHWHRAQIDAWIAAQMPAAA